jgi:hypothetical protein
LRPLDEPAPSNGLFDDDGQAAREQRRRSVGEGIFRERADRAPGGMFDDSPYRAQPSDTPEHPAIDTWDVHERDRNGRELERDLDEPGARDEGDPARDERAYGDPDQAGRDFPEGEHAEREYADRDYADRDCAAQERGGDPDPAARTDEDPLRAGRALEDRSLQDPAPAEPAPADDPAAEALGTVLAEFAARRRAAQETAATTEAIAAAAAERAAAAIAAAARAADEAEAAADAAARAAEDAAAALEAERRAVAAAGGRVLPPGQGRPQGGPGPAQTARVQIGPQYNARQAHPGPPWQGPPQGPSGPRRTAWPEVEGTGQHGPPGQQGHQGPGSGPTGHTGPWRRPPGPPGPQGPPRGWLPGEAATVVGLPVDGGRAARRRAAEASGVIDADSTEVLTGLHALREPAGGESPPGAAEVTAVTRLRRPTSVGDDESPEHPDSRDHLDDVDDEDDDREPVGWAGRLPARPALAAVAVVVALAVVALVAALTGGSAPAPAPAPAAVVGNAETTTAIPAPPAGPGEPAAVDPRSEQAVAYLTALRDADIPTSRSGQAETEAAAVICQQLGQGADEASLVRTLPAVLPDLTRAQAAEVVSLAQEHYC